MHRLVAAIDVGGTSIKAALVAEDLRVVHTHRAATRRVDGSVDVGQIVELIDELRAAAGDARVVGVGVAAPGIVDERHGIARAAVNLGWRDLPLRDQLSEAAGMPVALGHDVRTGGLAEFTVGAATGKPNAMFVPIGTGIAAAVLVDGHRLDADGYAGELGHVVVDPLGAVCGCGTRGCLETVASAAFIARNYAARTGRPVTRAAEVAAAVEAGDPDAVAVWSRAIDGLATALTTAVTLLAPEVVAIGGGLAESGDTLLEPLRESLAERMAFQRMPTLVRAALGDNAGCIGAGIMAWRAAS
ncbi:ROK family protein [Actinophytocola gossypii]|uniref:ROK family protein n=1 Tax=Actinophytocola gossypii TaxID=2812003 RepID=A0ABT2J654_9PSEU|nr:ROK family protein [Actinophytocola gossypii]MCT2583352.1 ROK family protein [Actinophytocola gossypii]